MTNTTPLGATSPHELLSQFPADFRHLTPVEQRVSIALYANLPTASPLPTTVWPTPCRWISTWSQTCCAGGPGSTTTPSTK